VDDILLFAPTKQEAEHRATELINLLTTLGMQINAEKTMKEASQSIEYIGHQFNLKQNIIKPIPEKTQNALKLVTHQLKSNMTTPKYLAAVAGTLMDVMKSNVNLQGLPQQIMRCAAQGVNHNSLKLSKWNRLRAWGISTPKQQCNTSSINLQQLLTTCKQSLNNPTPRVFRPTNDTLMTLQTDASDKAWGATLLLGGKEIAASAQRWTASQSIKHISHKETMATSLAIHHMWKMLTPGCQLKIQTDAAATHWAWKKGSKNKAMNDIIRSTYIKLNQKGIHVTSEHIPGCTNHRADYLSRNPDPKDYQLNPRLYQQMCKKFNYHPALDLFANKWNRQTKKYCSWRQDRNSQGNAWKLRWDKQTNWLNPPWELIPRALNKLQQDKATAMVCLPMWKSAPWYSKMVNMMQAEPHIIKDKPIYKDPEGKNMPPPRWATLITILQG
jgi:hypothetical protein